MLDAKFHNEWMPRVLGLLRIITGFLFLQHGTEKLLGVPHIAMFDGVQIMSLMGVAGILNLWQAL